MKKLILHSLFFAASLLLITGCSKQVKAPASKVTASSTANKTVTATTTTQTGHTCQGSNSSGYGGAH